MPIFKEGNMENKGTSGGMGLLLSLIHILYEAVVKEQEKRKKSNGRNNTKGNNSPAL